jgi:hypothetical protein
MRRIMTWFMSTVTILVLLFGYHTSTSGAFGTAGTASSVSPPNGGTGQSKPTTGARVTTGPVVPTQWGPVQVQVTVDGGVITDVTPLQYPTGNSTDDQINGYALPILIDQTMQAQGANIDMVSGATVTSTGYIQSLQAALDRAGVS